MRLKRERWKRRKMAIQVGIIATDETKDRYSHGIIKSIGSREERKQSHIIFMRCCVILTAVM